MKVLQQSPSESSVALSIDELMIINNALNEILNGVEIPGFHSRIGATREEVALLLQQIGKLL
jgi:hypothetical protein